MSVFDEIRALAHGARTFRRMAGQEKDAAERVRLKNKAEKWMYDARALKMYADMDGVKDAIRKA